ncbi:MAG: class I SAM-dependent methyltransferase [Rubrivivax sp.]
MLDLQIVLMLMLLCVGLLGFACLHKLRRIHVISIEAMNALVNIRAESEQVFAQIQALMSLERRLSLPRPLPPLRGWAASPDMLLRLADHVLENPLSCVLECSSGSSTLVIARCLQLRGHGHVYSLEHDPRYAQQTRERLRQYGLDEWATVLDAPLRPQAQGSDWYSLDALPSNLPPVDLLVIDGPPVSTGPHARYAAVPRLLTRLAPDCSIWLDDAARDDEQQILKRWLSEFPEWQQEQVACEKGLCILRRVDHRKET